MAINFDGTNDYVSVAGAASINNLGPMTWMTWAVIDAFGLNLPRIWQKGGGAVGSSRGVMFLRSATSLRFDVNYSTTSLDRSGAVNLVRLGRWDHWTVTWDGSTTATNVAIYRNAIESATYVITTNGAGAINDAPHVVTMGANSDAGGDFDGKLAHLQVWNRVLSTDEIQQAMHLPGSVQVGLVQYYPMDYLGPNSRQLHDFSGLANHGTGAGVTVFTTSQPQTTQAFVVPAPHMGYAG